jgi:fatty acid synthase
VTFEPGSTAVPPPFAGAPRTARGRLSADPLQQRIARGDVAVAVSFAGQGVDVLEELVALVAGDPGLLERVEQAERLLTELAATPLGEASGAFRHGTELRSWVIDPDAAPPAAYRRGAALSYPLLLLAQTLLWDTVARDGLGDALASGRVVAATGHSQGLLAALMLAEAAARDDAPYAIDDALFARYLRYSWAQGLHMAAAAEPVDEARELAPLVAVGGVRRPRLDPLLDAVNARLPASERVAVALANGPTAHVVGGPQASLALLREALEARAAEEQAARRAGARGGAPLRFTWSPLPVDVAFHTPRLAAARERFAGWLAGAGDAFALPTPDALGLAVLSPVDGEDLREATDLTATVLDGQFTVPVRWDAVCRRIADRAADWVLDLGPGTAAARLTGDNLRGTGIHAVGLASPDGRRVLATPASAPEGPGVRYAELAPKIVTLPDGRRHVDTRYTRLLGAPPVVLAGMTPTTTDAPIVAAAANAGYTAELAGGGQPDRFTFDRRMDELAELLEPGRTVAFNTLLLDRHLWGLHVEREGLLFAARDAGMPIGGLTVSAGVPEVDEAIALLDRLAAHGLRTNAFKPGTVEQIQRTLAIADAAPHHLITVQIEGGQGGGHHSWEDLDELLLATYHELRRRDNVVVVVGGGIGTPERARELLTGTWSARYDEPPMPVDAVLVGTAAMAVAEAAASPQVKRALVAAAGTTEWVPRTGVEGGVTSATSNLNADIHLLENSAARAGKLLQQVAGDADAVAARRDEIVAALARTAKPYFGDLDAMSYGAVLDRTVALLAAGRHGRYDDGAWGHPTWRGRALALFVRFAARLDAAERGEIAPPVAVAADLDDPSAALAAFRDAYPHADDTLLHPVDRQYVLEVCDRPGKPVPFVPVLDAEVRRWYMADGLWQAQDDRLDADAVFVIPGPRAVAGIVRDDEPVAELLARFEAATIDALDAAGVEPAVRERLADPGPLTTPLARRAAGFSGAVAAFCAAPHVVASPDGARVTDNPVATLVRDGAEIAVVEADEARRIVRIDVTPQHGADGERLEIVAADDGAVEVRISLPGIDAVATTEPLSLRFVPLATPGAFAAVGADGARAAFARASLLADPAADGARAAFAVDPRGAGELRTGSAEQVTERRWALDGDRIAAYRAATGATHDGVPVDLALSLAWPAVAGRLGEDPQIAARLAELVHARHEVVVGPAWPPAPGDEGTVTAEIVGLDDPADGPTRVRVRAQLRRGDDGPLLATVHAGLVIVGPAAVTDDELRRTDDHERTIAVDEAVRTLLVEQPWLTVADGATIARGDRLEVRARTTLRRGRDGTVVRTATGALRRDGAVVATIALDETLAAEEGTVAGVGGAGGNPVQRTLELLADADPTRAALHARPRRTLATTDDVTPESLRPFARIGGDGNPLHRCVLAARMAGLDAPIVHGAWTAARASAFVVDELCDGDASALERWRIDFVAPVAPGALIDLEASRTAVRDGRTLVEVRVLCDGRDVALGEATIAPPARRPRALLFPGQGIQKRGLGAEGRGRSAAARAVWRDADAFLRAHTGLRLSEIVDRDPTALTASDGTVVRHPAGLLQRTEITQVALVALAAAQLAELRAEGVLPAAEAIDPGIVAAGHSVGEFSALLALGVLDLAQALRLVHARGEAMQRHVPRDADGTSPYAMAVVDPRAAGTDRAGLEAAIAALAAEGLTVEIANHNARDRQYAVVGVRAALDALAARLPARGGDGGREPVRILPGIDVPFHSSVLAPAVGELRAELEATLGPVDHRRLVARWVPNLVARPFALDAAFVGAVADATGDPELPARLPAGDPDAAARVLVVELLAAQLAAPVRWEQTVDALLAPAAAGGLGVGSAVELAPPHAAVVSGLVRSALRRRPETAAPVALLHLEHDRDAVFARDADPVDVEAADDAPSAEPDVTTPAPGTPVAAADSSAATAAAPAPVAADPTADRPIDAGDALRFVLAVQARIRIDQLDEGETIDELFQGVSSRRNQVLIDLGREFALSGAEAAQQATIGELVAILREQGERYRFPGPYLRETLTAGLTRVLGRAGISRAEASRHLHETWGLGPGLTDQVLIRLVLDTRDGPSARGEALARLAEGTPTGAAAGQALLDRAAELTAADLRIRLDRAAPAGEAASAAATVVAAHVETALLDAIRTLADGLGRPLPDAAPAFDADAPTPADARLATLDAELGADRAAAVAPRFDPRRHVRLSSAWASARWDAIAIFHDVLAGRSAANDHLDAAARIARHADDPALADTLRWLLDRAATAGHAPLGALLMAMAHREDAAPPLPGVRPTVDVAESPAGLPTVGEQPDATRPHDLIGRITAADPRLQADLDAALRDGLGRIPDRSGEVALVTGASPGSIAAELVRRLLAGGATVVVATSTLDRARRRWYRELYREAAGPGAELHLLPANLASFADVDALLAWLAAPTVVQRQRPDLALPPLVPTIVAPFAAASTEGDLRAAGATSEAALRLQLLGVERLVAGVAGLTAPRRPATVLLPLSPNHGDFGGDGPYAETKAGLEVLLRRWRSEHDRWGHGTALIAPRIGWVRGTGLMEAAGAVAPLVEERLGVRTFAPAELGWILAALLAPPIVAAARTAPVVVDAAGGLGAVEDLRGALDPLVAEVRDAVETAARLRRLRAAVAPAAADARPTVPALPSIDASASTSPGIGGTSRHAAAPSTAPPTHDLRPEDLVVIVGTGELGPTGTGRTRFDAERDGDPSPGAVAELAWLCGLVRFETERYRGRWVDVASGQDVPEHELADRYADAVAERTGVRPLESDGTIDAAGLDVLTPVAVERELSFVVDDAATARALAGDGGRVTVTEDGGFRVALPAGSQVRVARVAEHRRRVAGQLPTGLDLSRWGVPDDLIASADRMALVNLACTSEAFGAAGIEPEELLGHVHPTLVANTQGCGLGGMASLRRLLLDHLLDETRQPDRIQESLGNVVAAHVVQSYVGSYGPMVHPVAACATAAVSLEEAHDKIRSGKARAVLAGGFDDLTPEGLIGFGDMGATASSDELDAMGIDPQEASRPGDLRRRGFVEAQGGGALLVVRGDVALELGLPVRAVLAYAGSFADGIQASIPAPGLGILGAATGGADSPLARGLARLGLTVDDVAVVSKHDTATEINDPHEADVHDRIQTALGRTPGNPLLVVSQKSVTGHSKGGAAAWQVDGVLRTMETGVVPGNQHLESVDPALREARHLAFGDREIVVAPGEPVRAAIVASLGFGHVGALLALAHPDTFLAAVPAERRDAYRARAARRRAHGEIRRLETQTGRPPVVRREQRRIAADGGAERDAEARAILDPTTRFRGDALRGADER